VDGAIQENGGQLLGRYRLVSELGQGGMAEVFVAKAAGPKGFEKTLVVKRILPQFVQDQQFVDMFLSEAKLAALLNHPNIVQIFDFGEADGEFFIAMEYIDGPNLRTLSRRARALGKRLPYALCAKIISLACEGLSYAHAFKDPETHASLNLIHRDVSPDNILLARNGAVKLVDFGIAKASNQSHQTQAGVKKGKVAYMSPELLRDEVLDQRSDVFSLGVVLYGLLAGRKPFRAESDVAMMQAIAYQPMVPIQTVRADVPDALQQVLEKALAKDRTQRYQNCREMQVALERYLHGTGEAVGAFQLAQLVEQLGPYPLVPVKGTPRAGSRPRMVNSEASGTSGSDTGSGSGSGAGSRSGAKSTPLSVVSQPQVAFSRKWIALGVVGLLAVVSVWTVVLVKIMGDRGPAPSAPVAGPTTVPAVTVPPVVITAPPMVPAPTAPTSPAAMAAAEPVATPKPPTVPAMVDVQIQVEPLSARLMLDGEPLPSNPYSGKLPRDEKPHVLRASAPGFLSAAREIHLDRDNALSLGLQRPPVVVDHTPPRRVIKVKPMTAPVADPKAITASPTASDDFVELPPKPSPKGNSKRNLDTDNPYNEQKRSLDTDNPWKN